MAETVVSVAFFRVGEDLVGFTDFFEFIGGAVAGVFIGMILEGQLAEGFLYIVFAGVPAHPEHFIIITFSNHVFPYSTLPSSLEKRSNNTKAAAIDLAQDGVNGKFIMSIMRSAVVFSRLRGLL